MQTNFSRIFKVFLSAVIVQLGIGLSTADFTFGWKMVATSVLTSALYAGFRSLEGANTPTGTTQA